jgi:putative membrane protein
MSGVHTEGAMMWWGWGPSWLGMPFWPILMFVMMAACIGMMIMMMRGGMRMPWHGMAGHDKTARDILDERYARGEIDPAEYVQKRRQISN